MKIDKRINKRGDITTQQIVLLIILIASFAVILFFIFRLNLGQTTEKEVCHNSVLTRGSKVLPGESVPLNCKTTYICISEDGTCEQVTSPDIKRTENKDEVFNALANEMADCWWVFGEGKINYVGEELFSKLYCSLCSQVSFDDSVGKIFPSGEIDKTEFYRYLATTNISNKDLTYLDYLVGLKNSQAIEDTLTTNQSAFGKININKQSYVVMGTISKVSVVQWAVAGAGIAVLAVVTAGAAIPVVLVVGAAGGVGGHFIGTIIDGVGGQSYLSPTIIEANSADFNSLKCESIQTLA
ncbi:MAG: hypothetical protein PHQ66_00710 [Candidatus Nanoarchaeia archaeon]|nr:hypothetical protein [Candidatus Nanoarchaeia archaeon]MDD5589015.1 hypothetical protein [Candidatus Nanoarchaeia archaeon]